MQEPAGVARIAITGAGAELAAAALIRARRDAGQRVAALHVAPPDHAAEDFVFAAGGLGANACFWLEWAAGHALGTPPEDAVCVVIAAPAGGLSVADGLDAVWAADAYPPRLDAFGRPGTDPAATRAGPALRIGICGTEARHRIANPAVLVRLADAADRIGAALEPVFLPADVPITLPDDLAGIVLPGGADMAEVEAQIAAARIALAHDLPCFGLCLGMQSMATMILRDAGHPAAALEEIAGPGPRRSFVRLCDATGAPVWRLGDRAFRPRAGTHLAALLTNGAMLRMNHRFHLNPAFGLLPGLVLHPSTDGTVIDAIEHPARRFFIGFQGHPELGCDAALDRLWDAFLNACRSAAFRPRT